MSSVKVREGVAKTNRANHVHAEHLVSLGIGQILDEALIII